MSRADALAFLRWALPRAIQLLGVIYALALLLWAIAPESA